MCEYCELSVGIAGPFLLQGEHDETGTYIYHSGEGFFLINNQDQFDEVLIKACPICGEHLESDS